MVALSSRIPLTPEKIHSRIALLGEEKWKLIREIVQIQTHKIILPGFPRGINWENEGTGQFGLETAREDFSKRLLATSQMNHLLGTLSLLDDIIPGITYSVFSDLLRMKGSITHPYLIEGNTSIFSRIGLSEKKPHGFFLSDDSQIQYSEISGSDFCKAYKVRLQAD